MKLNTNPLLRLTRTPAQRLRRFLSGAVPLASTLSLLALLTSADTHARAVPRGGALEASQPSVFGLQGLATAVQDPSLPGPYEVQVETFLEEAGYPTNMDIYLPGTSSPRPGIVLGHGFSQHKAYQEDNARHLASWGFVVLVPTFSSYSDHAANGAEMLQLAEWLIGPENPYMTQVDRTSLGLAGHSAGGLATVIASGLDAGGPRLISAVMGLDPVDTGQGTDTEGIPYAKDIAAPTFFLTGISYKCNSNGNAQALWDAIPLSTAKLFLRVSAAVHCDFNTQGIDDACTPGMKPARPLEILRLLATSGWDEAYAAATAGTCAVEGMEEDRTDEVLLIQKYLAAWFLAQLSGETWAEAYLFDGSEVLEDLSTGIVSDLQY